MKGRKLEALTLGLVVAALAGSPAQAALDEGGAAVAAPQARAEGFDRGDAAVGAGIGAAAVLAALGSAHAVRRRRVAPHDVAGPAAR